MLDAGCGTGHYGQAFLDVRVGGLSMIDASEGMLKAARQKVENNPSVTILKATIPVLPFEDATFDVVMFNQV